MRHFLARHICPLLCEDHYMVETTNEFSGLLPEAPRKKTLDAIIRRHVHGAIAVGLIPVPIVDFIGLTGVQLNMLKKIADEYHIPYQKKTVTSLISSLAGGALPSALTGPLAASVAKAVPLMGQTAGVVTMPILAGAATYAIGKVFVQHFASGGTFLTFDPDQVREHFEKMYHEGRKVAGEVEEEIAKEPASQPPP